MTDRTSSILPEVIDLLVSGIAASSTAAVSFRLPTATGDGTTVYDGPEFLAGSTTKDTAGFLVVGWGGEDVDTVENPNAPGDVAAGGPIEVRAIATSSPKDHPEDEIRCVAVRRAETPALARVAARNIVDAVDSFLRADPKLGYTPTGLNQLLWVQLTDWELVQWWNSGAWASVRFTLTVKSRT